MKKNIIKLSFVFLVLIIALISCISIPNAPANVPPDEKANSLTSGNSDKSLWEDKGLFINMKLDTLQFLAPLDTPDYAKLRVKVSSPNNALDISNSEVANVYLYEDGKAKSFNIYNESTYRKSTVDIAIILDTTGSMGWAIEGVKTSIINFTNTLISKGYDARVGVVPYDDDAPASQQSAGIAKYKNLDSPYNIQSYVKQLVATGGGDYPENPYDAIVHAVNNFTWRAESQKVFILITDATAHYPGDSTGSDNHAVNSKNDAFAKLQSKGATLHSVVAYGSPDDSLATMQRAEDVRELSLKTGGLIIYMGYNYDPTKPGSGMFYLDLSKLGIVESITNTYILIFRKGDVNVNHNIKLYIEEKLPADAIGITALRGYKELLNLSYKTPK